MDCLFCKIAQETVPASIIYKDDEFVVFKDINPKAPIHILIIPRKHIVSINHLEAEDESLIGKMFLTAKKIAKKLEIDEKGYKLVFNVGRGGGQIIDHLHLHLLAGWKNSTERNVPGMP